MVMRSRPANIRVIHRRCRSADQMTGYTQRPAPGWLRSRVRGFEVLSNVYEPLTLDTVFPYQKSNWTLNFQNRGWRTPVGASQFADGVAEIAELNAWL